MYARVTTFHIKLDKQKEAIEIYQKSILPEAKEQNGFIGATFFVNKNAGKFISTTIWENMEAAVSNQRTGYYQKQIDKFANILVVVPEFEGYDVPVLEYVNLI